jgi:arylsulfatase A-like enzyme
MGQSRCNPRAGTVVLFWSKTTVIRKTVSALLLLVCLAIIGAAQKRPQPNIVFIMVDDLGYGDLSGYGARDIRTPHLDALAGAGMRFTNFYANAPVCSPSRAAFLTGQYPDLAGVPGVIRTHADNSWGRLSPRVSMLPARLREAGYATAIVGKWHLGLELPDAPNDRGFDHFHGFLGDMMDDYYDHLRHGRNYMRLNRQTIDPKGHATDIFTDWATDYLKSRQGRAQPFFLYLAYNAPHDPIQPPKEWLEKVRQREPGIGDKRAGLVALIEQMDDGIGRVLGTLAETGLDRETLVIFTSDNGGLLSAGATNGPLRGGKQDLYEGGLRVPMIAAWPGRIPAGSQSDRIALHMDLYATICEATGAVAGPAIDGRSILPTLRGQKQPDARRDLFWMRREGGTKYRGQDYYAIRRGPWKMLHNSPFEPLQLFNLEADPLEQKNLFASESKVVEELTGALQLHLQRAGAVPWQKPQGQTKQPKTQSKSRRID